MNTAVTDLPATASTAIAQNLWRAAAVAAAAATTARVCFDRITHAAESLPQGWRTPGGAPAAYVVKLARLDANTAVRYAEDAAALAAHLTRPDAPAVTPARAAAVDRLAAEARYAAESATRLLGYVAPTCLACGGPMHDPTWGCVSPRPVGE